MDAFEGVSSLLDKSLMRQEEGPEGEPRFVMLETIHEYAREKLQESGEAEEIGRSHARVLPGPGRGGRARVDGCGSGGMVGATRSRARQPEGSALLVARRRRSGAGARLANALSYFWFVRGYWSEGRGWLEEALAGNAEDRAEAQAKALRVLANLAVEQGDYERAETAAEEALALFRELGDEKGVSDSLGELGWVSLLRGDYERAEAPLEQSLAAARESDDAWSTARALNALAVLVGYRDDFERAEALWEESLELGRKLGDSERVRAVLLNMGYARADRGDFELAGALFEEGLAMSR